MSITALDEYNARLLMKTYPEFMRNIRLTEGEIKILDIVKSSNRITAPELAHAISVSLQNAGAKLKKLFDKGYLSREQEADPTGGIIYIYHHKAG